MKNTYKYLIIAILIACTFFIGGYILSSPKEQYIYIPNAVLIKKPIALELIKDKKRLEEILKTTSIVDAHYASMGSALRLQGQEIFLVKAKDLLQEYEIAPIAKQAFTTANFYPQYIGKRYPIPVQIIKTQQETLLIKSTPSIYKGEQAQIGAAISLSLDGEYLNLIPKEIIEKDYKSPIELRSYIKQSFKNSITKE